jgi:hypothetical protein
MSVPHGYQEIVTYFGDPCFDGRTVSSQWENRSMLLARDLPGLDHSLYCHRYIEGPLRAALAACVALGDGYKIRKIGCFAPRLKRGLDQVSIHTFGAAVDINPDQNPLITNCPPSDPRRAAPGARDVPDTWIDCFRAQGFVWGGDFATRFDAMHFQLASGY